MEAVEMEMYGGGVWVKQKKIGSGSSSTVFLAKSKAKSSSSSNEDGKSFLLFPQLMAVKSAPLSDAENLFKEIKVFSKLKDSPYIVQYYGYTITIENQIETINLCLEFAPGGSLSDRIKKSSTFSCNGLPEDKVRRYTYSILQGLKHIYECGFVHCDLKPQNILMCDNDVAKIADFDLSARTDEQKSKYKFIGTPLYVAPEAIFSKCYETSSDVWGLGCVVLEMLSGRKPWGFDKKNNIDVDSVLNFIADSDELPVVDTSKLSSLAVDFLSKCLIRDRSNRWSADMLLKHPFVAIDSHNQTEVLDVLEEASSSSSEFDLPSSFGLKKKKKIGAVVKVPVDDTVVGEKRKRTMTSGDEEEEIEELERWQQKKKLYWCVKKRICSMDDAVPCGQKRHSVYK